jgi:hypothetical protein
MDPLAYDVKEGAEASKVSVTELRRAIRAGKLKVSRIGRRIVIPAENLRRFVREGWAK